MFQKITRSIFWRNLIFYISDDVALYEESCHFNVISILCDIEENNEQRIERKVGKSQEKVRNSYLVLSCFVLFDISIFKLNTSNYSKICFAKLSN